MMTQTTICIYWDPAPARMGWHYRAGELTGRLSDCEPEELEDPAYRHSEMCVRLGDLWELLPDEMRALALPDAYEVTERVRLGSAGPPQMELPIRYEAQGVPR